MNVNISRPTDELSHIHHWTFCRVKGTLMIYRLCTKYKMNLRVNGKCVKVWRLNFELLGLIWSTFIVDVLREEWFNSSSRNVYQCVWYLYNCTCLCIAEAIDSHNGPNVLCLKWILANYSKTNTDAIVKSMRCLKIEDSRHLGLARRQYRECTPSPV